MSTTFLTDLANSTVLGQSISSATAQTTNANGASFDAQLTDGPIAALVDVSAVAGTGSPSLTVQLQESSDGTTWTNISSEGTGNAQAGSLTVTATGDTFISTNQRLKRYVRAATTGVTGNSPSFTMSVVLIGRKKILGTGAGFSNASAPGAGF